MESASIGVRLRKSMNGRALPLGFPVCNRLLYRPLCKIFKSHAALSRDTQAREPLLGIGRFLK